MAALGVRQERVAGHMGCMRVHGGCDRQCWLWGMGCQETGMEQDVSQKSCVCVHEGCARLTHVLSLHVMSRWWRAYDVCY